MLDISIVIPVYNGERYLRECLESLINQTLKKIEIICVDDCSTDISAQIIQEYAQKHNNIIYLKTEKNYGAPGKARNVGIDFAKGEYIGFVDADDYVSENYFESLYVCAKNNDADMALNSVLIKFNENGIVYIDQDKDESFILDTPEKMEHRYIKSAYTYIKIFRRSFLNKYDLRCYKEHCVAEDNYLTCISMALANKVVVTYDAKYYYRRHQENITAGTRGVKNFNVFDMYSAIDAELEKYIKEGLVDKKYRQLMNHRKLIDFGYFLEKNDPHVVEEFKERVRQYCPYVAHKLGFTRRGAFILYVREILSPVKQALLRLVKKFIKT